MRGLSPAQKNRAESRYGSDERWSKPFSIIMSNEQQTDEFTQIDLEDAPSAPKLVSVNVEDKPLWRRPCFVIPITILLSCAIALGVLLGLAHFGGLGFSAKDADLSRDASDGVDEIRKGKVVVDVPSPEGLQSSQLGGQGLVAPLQAQKGVAAEKEPGPQCTSDCDSCVAAEGATHSHGVTDHHCAMCADGYPWWPCDPTMIDKCLCKGEPKPKPKPAACTEDCDTCVAAEGATHSHGVTDHHCAMCADGYPWWPCDPTMIDKCLCKMENGEDPAPEPPSPQPSPQPIPTPSPSPQPAPPSPQPQPEPTPQPSPQPSPQPEPTPVPPPCELAPAPGPSIPSPTPPAPSPTPDSECSQDLTLITRADWEALFPHRNSQACRQNKFANGTLIPGGFFEFEKFVAAAEQFPCFLGRGEKKRELAAFLAQISHETTGGWATAPGGPQAWGLCWKEEVGCEAMGCAQYCAPGDPCTAAGEEFPCPCEAGKFYHGRGPMQLSWNYNYEPAGRALGVDLLAEPERITQDPVLAFSTAIYFWMTPRDAKPSCHSVMVGEWSPSDRDRDQGRLPGFGTTTNIINGQLECNIKGDSRVEDRVLYYERYAKIFGVSPGDNLYCDKQKPFSWG